MPGDDASDTEVPGWVAVSLRGKKVVDVEGDMVSIEFTLDLPDDKAWYQCFAQATGPLRSGGAAYVSTTPQFSNADTLTWRIELSDLSKAAQYLAGRIDEANRVFRELLERKEQIRRQLEDAARRRQEAIADAQRILDDSWPPEQEPPAEEGHEAPAAEGTG